MQILADLLNERKMWKELINNSFALIQTARTPEIKERREKILKRRVERLAAVKAQIDNLKNRQQ